MKTEVSIDKVEDYKNFLKSYKKEKYKNFPPANKQDPVKRSVKRSVKRVLDYWLIPIGFLALIVLRIASVPSFFSSDCGSIGISKSLNIFQEADIYEGNYGGIFCTALPQDLARSILPNHLIIPLATAQFIFFTLVGALIGSCYVNYTERKKIRSQDA